MCLEPVSGRARAESGQNSPIFCLLIMRSTDGIIGDLIVSAEREPCSERSAALLDDEGVHHVYVKARFGSGWGVLERVVSTSQET